MDLTEALDGAVRRVAFFDSSHAVKAVLAADRLSRRYDELGPGFFDRVLPWESVLGSVRVDTLIHTLVDRESTPRPKPYDERRARVMISRAVFPAAYWAAIDWHRQSGLGSMIEHYRADAIAHIAFLGHSWSVWSSFHDLVPHLRSEQTWLFATERFAEFASGQFKTPSSFGDFPESPRPDAAPVHPSRVLDACLDHPGFLGHNLIVLGHVHRHERALTDAERRAAFALTLRMAEASGAEDPPADAERTPAVPVGASDLRRAVVRFVTGGRAEAHTLTLADAVHDLWPVASDAQRARILAGLQV